MDYTERLKSKNWKERQEAYQELGNFFKEGKYLEYLPLLQNETNIPALETAIDAILKAPIISTSEVSKIFLQIGNNKTSIKNRLTNLIENIKDSELITSLLDLTHNKNPKVVSGAVSFINLKLPDDCTNILENISNILNHPDKNVRSEGFKLAVEIYKKVGLNIKKYLNIKPILMKELEEEFNKIKVIKKEPAVIDLDKINDPKWNIRVEGLNQILKSDTFSNTDILFGRINDPNNQVFFLLLDIINKFNIKSIKLINALIERLKDKKSIITDKIKDTLVNIGLSQVNCSYFLSKSPELKINLIEVCLKCRVEDPEVISCIIKCTEDSSGTVRSKALEALKGLKYDRSILPREILLKIEKSVEKEMSSVKEKSVVKEKSNVVKEKSNVVKESTERKIINKESTDQKDIKKISKQLNKQINDKQISNKQCNKINKKRSISSRIQVTVNKAILDTFYEKYPFLAEKVWTVRLEGIKSNINILKKEGFTDLSLFIYSCRDPNFQINILYVDILLSRISDIENEEILIYYCIEKCTEIKMRTKILELLKVLDTTFVLEILIEEACKIKKGKKFVEIVKILENWSYRDEIEDLFKISVTGLQEKKAIEELKKKVKQNEDQQSEDQQSQDQKSEDNRNEESLIIVDQQNEEYKFVDQKNSIIVEDSNISLNEESTHEIYSNNDSKIHIKKDLKTLMEEGDVFSVINLLDSLDVISLSRSLIDFLIFKDVQSTFFNSLMVHFISRKHILEEEECDILINHFINKGFYEEFSMIDRIYPVTKLFLILKKKLEMNEGDEYIIKLIEKYLNIEDKGIIREKMLYSTDFLNFIDNINSKNSDKELKFNVTTSTVNKINDVSFNDTVHKFDKKNDYKNEDKHDKKYDNKKDIENDKFGYVPEKKIFEENKGIDFTKYQYTNINNEEKIKVSKKKPNDKLLNLIAPSVYESADLDIDIESSLDCLNLSQGSRLTPNVKKFRKEFMSPLKNIENLEDILDNIIDSDQNKSEEAFRKLSEIIKKNINTVLFSANSIMSSISIQLLDVLHRPLYAKLILNVLLRLSQSQIFCEHIRKETLESCNIDLINILKNEELSDVVSDILTNLCLNSKMSVILEVYLKLIENNGDIPLKLIWRHSKSLDMKNKEEIQKVIDVLEDFYRKSVYSDLLENVTTFKISILHLREICIFYQDKVLQFNFGRYVSKIVERIMKDGEININVIRK